MNRFRWLAPYDIIMLLYLALAIAIEVWLDLDVDYSTLYNFKYHAPFLALMLLYAWVYAVVIAVQERRSGRDRIICGQSWWNRMRDTFFNAQFAWDFLRLMVYLKLMFVIYCNIKQAIPRINPTIYDEALHRIDKWLHFGFDPITMMHGLFSSRGSMLAMDWLYVSWYAVLAPVVMAFVATTNWRRRNAFFSCFFLMWIVAGLLAVAGRSLGPIYIMPERFAHMEMPEARVLQEQLWTSYQAALANPEKYRVLIYEGIAAFPSLHVGVVALFSLFLLQWNRIIGCLMVLYTLITLLGSVLLGWHYAIDGYATILLALILYWIFRPRVEKEQIALVHDPNSQVALSSP